MHGKQVHDEFGWLDAPSLSTRRHLAAEDRYARTMLGGADPLRRALVREMAAELAPHVSAVEALGDWDYYQRATTHLPCYCRRPRAGGPEQVFRPPPTSTAHKNNGPNNNRCCSFFPKKLFVKKH